MSRTRSNDDLAPIPGDDEVLAALAVLEDERDDDPHAYVKEYGIRAQHLAGKLGVAPARRGGRGAVKGSWSGSMAPALRLSPRLRSLERRGLVKTAAWGHRSVRLYRLTDAGRARVKP